MLTQKRGRSYHALLFTVTLLLLYFAFNLPYSNTPTGMNILAKVVDTEEVVKYNDSGATMLIVILSIFAVATGFILIPKYIRNIGVVLNVFGAVLFVIAIFDFFSLGISTKPIGNFIIAMFLGIYGLFILKKRIYI